MNDAIRPGNPSGRSNSSGSRTARLAHRLLAALARNWRDTLYLNERLVRAQRPWEQQGPLRWRRERGGWRMVGAYLPDGERTSSPAA
jgi:hypothetical protein